MSSDAKPVAPGPRPPAAPRNPLDAGVALLLFLVAAGVHGIALVLTPYAAAMQTVFGAPVADAFFWHQLATDLAAGEGLDTSLRPGYPLILAALFQFTGNGLAVAKTVNVVLAAATIAASYLLARVFLPLAAAVIFALALATAPTLLLQTHALLSEHAGVFFSTLSLWAILSGMRSSSMRPWLLAGGATALSNLARPMSLFALPLVAAVLGLQRRRAALQPIAWLVAGVLVLLGPWLLLQKLTHDVWDVSSNAAEVFYAATSPRYGAWTGQERNDLIAAGAIPRGAPVAEWSRLFRRLALENLQATPGVWIGVVKRALTASLGDPGLLPRQSPRHALSFAAGALALGVALGWRSRQRARSESPTRGEAVRLALLLVSMLAAFAAGGSAAVLLLLGCVGVVASTGTLGSVLIVYLFGNIASHALYGFATTFDRIGLMHAPFLVLLQLNGLCYFGVVVARQRLAGAGAVLAATASTPAPTARWQQAIVCAGRAGRIVTIVVAAGFCLLTLNLLRLNGFRIDPPAIVPVSAQQLERVRDEIGRRVALELARSAVAANPVTAEAAAGDLYFLDIRLPRSRIEVPPARAAVAMQLGYLRGVVREGAWAMFCGSSVDALLGRRAVVVTRMHVGGAQRVPELAELGPLLQVLAVVPVDAATGEVRVDLTLRFSSACSLD